MITVSFLRVMVDVLGFTFPAGHVHLNVGVPGNEVERIAGISNPTIS
jgi:hypothetical protein